ncbi:hypothetical protein D9619_008224 [Psilocybe cf. subviscida]|uniref:Uncharacterized protein n=1 Tax=Psilocybe cf. subviscida TaxID=2480587 RepID=A0A8H5AT17_9AGAR|nr:hypothetical protein D9619_008224 [Psilocybe cf. subviscida]
MPWGQTQARPASISKGEQGTKGKGDEPEGRPMWWGPVSIISQRPPSFGPHLHQSEHTSATVTLVSFKWCDRAQTSGCPCPQPLIAIDQPSLRTRRMLHHRLRQPQEGVHETHLSIGTLLMHGDAHRGRYRGATAKLVLSALHCVSTLGAVLVWCSRILTTG